MTCIRKGLIAGFETNKAYLLSWKSVKKMRERMNVSDITISRDTQIWFEKINFLAFKLSFWQLRGALLDWVIVLAFLLSLPITYTFLLANLCQITISLKCIAYLYISLWLLFKFRFDFLSLFHWFDFSFRPTRKTAPSRNCRGWRRAATLVSWRSSRTSRERHPLWRTATSS